MILATLLAAVVSIAPPFAPPVNVPLHYRLVEFGDNPKGPVRVANHQTLRFTRSGDGFEATLVPNSHEVEAPEPYRTLLALPLTPFEGVATRLRLDHAGAPQAIVDGARSWTALRSAENAALAGIETSMAIGADEKRSARTLIMHNFDLAPAAADAMLTDTVTMMLPPPLPALAVGEARGFTATLRSPAGTLPSEGTVTLVAADDDHLTYHVETRSDPAATDRAVAELSATLQGASMPETRARIAANVAAIRGTAYVEQIELVLDRRTGLMTSSHTVRSAILADGSSQPLGRGEIARED